MKNQDEYVALVIGAATVRGEKIPPVEFIEKAIARIEAGKESAVCYPGGAPSLKAVADIANRLHEESETKGREEAE